MKNAKAKSMPCPKKELMSANQHPDFAYALANHRPEITLDKSVNQSAARIHMMCYHIGANPVKPFPAPQIFITQSSHRLLSISNALPRFTMSCFLYSYKLLTLFFNGSKNSFFVRWNDQSFR